MAASLKQRFHNAYRAFRGTRIYDATRRDIPSISAEEVAEAKTFFPLEKFFIFGHARSGTTMLTRLIRLHPEVHCNYQAHFFTRPPLLEALVHSPEIGAWLRRESNRWNHGKDLSPVVLRAAADFILEREARMMGKRIVGDKSPNNLLHGEAVRLLYKTYPDARLIYIVRDGRDASISHRFQGFIDFPDQLSREDLKIRTEFIRQPDLFLHGKQSIFTKRALKEAAESWRRNVNETDRMGRELFNHHFITLRYEDLLQSTWEEMLRLWDFLKAGEPDESLRQSVEAEMAKNPDEDWQQQKAREIAEPLQKGKRGNWHTNMTAADQKVFWEIAGETLSAWGYLWEAA